MPFPFEILRLWQTLSNTGVYHLSVGGHCTLEPCLPHGTPGTTQKGEGEQHQRPPACPEHSQGSRGLTVLQEHTHTHTEAACPTATPTQPQQCSGLQHDTPVLLRLCMHSTWPAVEANGIKIVTQARPSESSTPRNPGSLDSQNPGTPVHHVHLWPQEQAQEDQWVEEGCDAVEPYRP